VLRKSSICMREYSLILMYMADLSLNPIVITNIQRIKYCSNRLNLVSEEQFQVMHYLIIRVIVFNRQNE